VSIVHVCRVIDLLAAGKDPSPPELAFEFYDMPEKADPLIVAQIDLGSDLSNLRPGDEIIAVGESPIANEGQFIHALRGKLNDADITVRRDGESIVIEGRFLPAPKITDR
jgi:S1-C subfamily serine protease